MKFKIRKKADVSGFKPVVTLQIENEMPHSLSKHPSTISRLLTQTDAESNDTGIFGEGVVRLRRNTGESVTLEFGQFDFEKSTAREIRAEITRRVLRVKERFEAIYPAIDEMSDEESDIENATYAELFGQAWENFQGNTFRILGCFTQNHAEKFQLCCNTPQEWYNHMVDQLEFGNQIVTIGFMRCMPLKAYIITPELLVVLNAKMGQCQVTGNYYTPVGAFDEVVVAEMNKLDILNIQSVFEY